MKIIFSLSLTCLLSLVNAQSGDVVINKMLLAIGKVESLSFEYKSKERFGSEIISSEGNAKLLINPRKIYFVQTAPAPVEILYNEEKNSNKALVKAKKLPVVNLGIYSNKMRKRSHYPITQLGFSPLVPLLEALKEKEQFENYLSISKEKFNGKDCYKLELNITDYQLEIYKTTKEEYPREIAKKRNISEHKIIELNDLSGYGKIKEGYYLTLPNQYAKKIILYIDRKNNLPIQQIIYDELGLYERFEYYNVKINPLFSPQDFPDSFK